MRLQIRDLSLVLTHVHILAHDAGRLASDGSDATERGTTDDLGSQVFKEVQARSSRTRYLISRIPSRPGGRHMMGPAPVTTTYKGGLVTCEPPTPYSV